MRVRAYACLPPRTLCVCVCLFFTQHTTLQLVLSSFSFLRYFFLLLLFFSRACEEQKQEQVTNNLKQIKQIEYKSFFFYIISQKETACLLKHTLAAKSKTNAKYKVNAEITNTKVFKRALTSSAQKLQQT